MIALVVWELKIMARFLNRLDLNLYHSQSARFVVLYCQEMELNFI